MLNTKQRNREISHLIETTVHDFCKVLECSYTYNKEAIMVAQEDEDLFYVYPEFNEADYDINIICMVYSDLSISKAAKLKEVYKSEEVAEYIDEAGASLWFMDDSRLVMSCVERSKYDDYAVLKSKLLLGIYANVINARKLKDKLGHLLVESELISANYVVGVGCNEFMLDSQTKISK